MATNGRLYLAHWERVSSPAPLSNMTEPHIAEAFRRTTKANDWLDVIEMEQPTRAHDSDWKLSRPCFLRQMTCLRK